MTMTVHLPRAAVLIAGAGTTGWLLASAGAVQAGAPATLETVVTAGIALSGALAALGIAAVTALGVLEAMVLRRPSRVHAALPATLRRFVTGSVAAAVLAGAAVPAHADEVYPGWAPPSPSPTLTSGGPSPSPSPVAQVSAPAQPAAPVWAPAAAPAPERPAVVELHAESSAPALETMPGPAASPVHVVVRGESLWRIAADLLGPDARDAEIARAWPIIYQANRATIGDDPGLILPGQRLTIPQEVAA